MIKKVVFLLSAFVSLVAAPQAIVFDFGGVMTKKSDRGAVVKFLCESFSLTSEEFALLNQEKRKAVLKSGKRDQDFWLEYAREKNICIPDDWEETFNQVMHEAIGVNHEMYQLVNKLKKTGISIVLLSNIDDHIAKIIRDFHLYEPFDPCLLSCEIGLEKPDPGIYHFLIEKMQLPANQIIFIDDKKENIEAAEKIGLDAILFTSQEKLEKELKDRGIRQFE